MSAPKFIWDYSRLLNGLLGKIEPVRGTPKLGDFARKMECMHCGHVVEIPDEVLDEPVSITVSENPLKDLELGTLKTVEFHAECASCRSTNYVSLWPENKSGILGTQERDVQAFPPLPPLPPPVDWTKPSVPKETMTPFQRYLTLALDFAALALLFLAALPILRYGRDYGDYLASSVMAVGLGVGFATYLVRTGKLK